jgi:hypothetical protein
LIALFWSRDSLAPVFSSAPPISRPLREASDQWRAQRESKLAFSTPGHWQYCKKQSSGFPEDRHAFDVKSRLMTEF